MSPLIMRLDKRIIGGKQKIKIGNFDFEEVDTFKYLGTTLSSDGNKEAEVKEKITAANRAYYANKKLLQNKILGKSTKMRIYKTVIRPVMMYAAETMTMTKKQEEDLRIVERKILRTILGPEASWVIAPLQNDIIIGSWKLRVSPTY
ncbi:uncharacterized protein LOC130894852 [Diorhabda carinulata]|uniref:uncharacterized protein LOC130894852 n=1 Tax=Diorhabda carinulata TaxID=1163345 RepID=UPI0025A1E281|nr:uncharacterized protein LOC130894852 [Diorhabda carinulata]